MFSARKLYCKYGHYRKTETLSSMGHCLICSKERMRQFRTKHERWYLYRKYKITPEQYLKLFQDQKGACAICGIDQVAYKRRLCVDHDHKTGTIRGLLCQTCNVMLGSGKDSPNILRKGIEYLETSRGILPFQLQ